MAEFIKAATSGKLETVEELAKTNDVNVKGGDGRTALHMASNAGHKNVVEFLIKNKADVNITDNQGRTALHMASNTGHKNVVEFLIKNKAKVNITDEKGYVPLHLATEEDQIEVMELLLKSGAVLNKANHRGRTSLHKAAYQGLPKSVQFLLAKNANINQVDDYGESALMDASKEGYTDVVTILLESGADTGLTNRLGLTAKEIAENKGKKYVVNLIDDAIAKDLAANVHKIDLSDCYPMKPKPAGTGVVAILANFTGQLKGYNNDIERVRTFFKDDLGYSRSNVLVYKDMCEDQFMENVRKIQDHISKTNGVDRLFVFVLSHGDISGIHMCKKGSTTVAEKEGRDHVSVSLGRLIARFQPEKTAALKGCPKVFIVQKCNGSGAAQAADMAEEEDLEDYAQAASLNTGPNQSSLSLSADVLQCQASCPNTKSFVADTGSVYIQKLCEEFEKNYRTKDVYEMLTAANLSVMNSETKVKTAGGQVENVWQMPLFLSTLTKKLRLYMAIN